jgi:flagellar hook-length control protein FliK
MSLLLPSTTAPSQSGNLSPNAKARSDEQGQNNSGSFGEVLSRSLAPAGETAEITSGKAATPAPARRQPGDHKSDREDLLNAMALSFVPLESRAVKAASTGGAVAAPDNTVSAATTAPLTDLLVTTPVPTDGSMAAKEVKEANTDAGAQTVPGPAIAAASQKDAGPATLQAKLNAVVDSSAIQLDSGKIAGQPIAPNTGSPDQSSKRDNRASNKPDDMTAVSADSTPAVTPAATHSTAKVIATAGLHSAETAAITITGSQAPATDTLSASAALPINPANTAAPGPAGVSTSNTPAAVTAPSLAPEVGSSEWGKALGQQVIQLSKAGHQVAELQLNPPGLGPLKVTLSMDDHQIQAMFVSAHSSVRAAVEAALPQLRTSLADSGISLGNTSVSAGSQQQTAFANSQNGQPDQRSYRSNSMVDTAAPAARPVTEPIRRSNGITVDTYA